MSSKGDRQPHLPTNDLVDRSNATAIFLPKNSCLARSNGFQSQQWFGEDADISAERRALIERLRVLADVEEDQVEGDGPFPFHFQQDSND